MNGNNVLTRITLDNDLTVLVKEVHYAPVASFWTCYRVGSRNEATGRTGISHWVEHMMFKGTSDFPKGQIDRMISREGGTWNGFTGLDFTAYFETLPADRVELAMRIESDRMVNSIFDPDEVDAERTVILSEREGNENSPGFLLTEEIQATAIRAHTYGHPVIGFRGDLERLDRDDLWQHYRTYYGPNNAVAIVVGDVATDQALEQVEKYFGDIPTGPAVPQLNLVEPPQRGEKRVTVRGPGLTSYLQLAFHAPATTDPGFFPLVVLDAVLNGAQPMAYFGGSSPSNRSSRLYRALVDTELAADVDTSLHGTVDPFLYRLTATVRSGQTLQEVEDAVRAELAKLREDPVREEELVKAIKQTRAQFAYTAESVTSQAYWLGYSEMIATHKWLDGYLDNLAAITAEDVHQVAQSYLVPENLTVGWYVPKDTESRP